MSDSIDVWRFDPYLVKYELKIVGILGNITQVKGVNPKYGILLGWFFIHPQLTQNQLEELTGISKSTFLPVLKYLESIGFLKREFISGTHIYRYIACKTIQQYTTEMIFNLGILYSRYHSFLSIILEKQSSISTPPEKLYLWSRMKDLDAQLLGFLEQFSFLKDLESIKPLSLSSSVKYSEISIGDLSSFTDVEERFCQFLTQYPLFPFPKTSMLSLFVIFVLHSQLTQSEIRTLSHLSIGAISQDLRSLMRLGIICEIPPEADAQKPKKFKTYSLNPMNKIMMILLKSIMNARMQWKPTLVQMKTELERKSTLKTKKGYTKLIEILDYMLSFYPLYEKILQTLNNV